MGIVSVKETFVRTAETNEKGQRSYTRTFTVITDDPWIGPAVAREAIPIAVGDFYQTVTEFDPGSYCLTKNATCTAEDGKQWTVTVSYGPAPEASETDNPLAEPLEVSWSYAQFEKPVQQDRYGAPIVNVCGDPFATEVMRDDSRPVLTIVRNEASFNAGLAWLYRDCVNSDAFFDAGPGMVKVSNISATRKWNPLFGWYWPVSYEFTFDANGYAKYLLNQGFRELDSDTGKLKLVTVNGVPVSEPVLLSKKGQVMPPNSPPYGLKFDIYYEASFGVFNF